MCECYASPIRSLLKALVLLVHILPRVPARPLDWLSGPPAIEQVRLPVGPHAVPVELYLPTRGRHRQRPGIVLTLGAADLGARDPRVVSFADALARSGFVVLVLTGWPAFPGTPETPFGFAEAPAVAQAAFEHLAARPAVDPSRVGFVGVCMGAAVCLLAAAQPAIAQRVAFVYAIGPYQSLRRLLWATVSRTTRSAIDDCPRPWAVSPWVLERLRGWLLGALPAAEAANVVAGTDGRALSEQGRAVCELLEGVPPERADAAIDRLGEPFLRALAAASPDGKLQGLRAPTYVMHSVADEYVPVDESRRLVRALRGQVPLHYAEFELFDHVDATRPLGMAALVREVWRLIQYARPLLQLTC